jgi:hypothetical protein
MWAENGGMSVSTLEDIVNDEKLGSAEILQNFRQTLTKYNHQKDAITSCIKPTLNVGLFKIETVF